MGEEDTVAINAEISHLPHPKTSLDRPTMLHNDLPDDVIRYTFIIAARGHRHIDLPYRRRAVPLPVTLSHVCSAWRRIALETSELWSDFNITYEERHYSMFKSWLSRVGGRSISASHIDLTLYRGSNVVQVFRDLFVPLRFDNVEFTMCCEYVSELVALSDDVFSHVKTIGLTVTLPLHWRGERLPLIPRFLARALHAVTIRIPHQGWVKLGNFAFPWQQLRTLKLLRVQLHILPCLELLGQCNSLRKCQLEVIPAPDGEEISTETINLPNLRHLIITATCDLDALFRPLFLPNLTTLRLYGRVRCRFDEYMIIRDQFNLSQLSEFRFAPEVSFRVPFSILLTDGPLLQKVGLPTSVKIDGEALSGLAKGKLGGHLKSLALDYPTCGVEAVVEMVEKRENAAMMTSSLSTISDVRMVCDTNGYDTEAVGWRVTLLEKRGIRVQIVRQ